MEMRIDNPVPNFLRISCQRATFDYRGVRRVDSADTAAWKGISRPSLPIGGVTGALIQGSEGCKRNCSQCGRTHATVDCTARRSYSTMTAEGSAADFPLLQERRETGDPNQRRPNERPTEASEDGVALATLETTDDTRWEDNMQPCNTHVAHSSSDKNEDKNETPGQAASTTDDKHVAGEDGNRASPGAGGSRHGDRDGGGGSRRDGVEDGRHVGGSAERRQASGRAARGQGKLSLRRDDREITWCAAALTFAGASRVHDEVKTDATRQAGV
ncbi:hypothetical protein HPB48_026371 [Haemaphysalis longicornis]|uniref:Uncharacterized protein n=1 Tax=Haemaphysalis longicornis TaxID=44386 RepID=A0A9J6HAK6_HAELO|nr:hypothetical protein HPB48_026371 [Haemaphysalis longicornis]